MACYAGQLNVVEMMLGRGVAADSACTDGATPLFAAAQARPAILVWDPNARPLCRTASKPRTHSRKHRPNTGMCVYEKGFWGAINT